MTAILAVDPGAAHTGIVVTTNGRLEHHQTIHARDHAAYRIVIADTLHHLIDAYLIQVVAVEDVTPPRGFVNGKRQPINPGTLIGTAAVLGITQAVAWQYGLAVRLIPPGGNGAGAYASYPAELVSTSERRGAGWQTKAAGKGGHCHERSAWDVAKTAARQAAAA